MADNNNNFAIMAMVAIVAVVGIVGLIMSMNAGSAKEIVVPSSFSEYSDDISEDNVAGEAFAVPLNKDASMWSIGGRTYCVIYGQTGPEGMVPC